MKKYLFAVALIVMCNPVNASILDVKDCSGEDQAKIAGIIATGIGVTAITGALVGAAAAAISSVGAVGGPMAIMYFPGKAAFGAWITKSVIPMSAGMGVASGIVGGIVATGLVSKTCEELLTQDKSS